MSTTKKLYIGPPVEELLKHRPESLSTVVNLTADRYIGILRRSFVGTTVRMDDVYRGALETMSRGKPPGANDIVQFPLYVREWLDLHKDYPEAAHDLVRILSYPQLVALIERLEKRP
jgi:hypothetical protein